MPNSLKTNTYSDATLTIDLSAIEYNYNLLKNLSAPAECAAVVKANAYGLGVLEVSKKLNDAGCSKFFVANLDEAIELRSILSDSDIFVFHGVFPGQEQEFIEKNLVPVLNDNEQISLWNNVAKKNSKALRSVIHVDTGINRLGLNLSDVSNIDVSSLDVVYVMSHLACISTPEDPKNKEQLQSFNKVKELFPNILATFSNSGAVIVDKSYHFDLVRPGCSLYGVHSVKGDETPLKNVVSLSAKIIQLREIDSDQTVGYGADYKVKAGSVLATVPVGYADGYLRSLGDNTHCFIGDVKVPVVGRVSMDMIVLDVTNLPKDSLDVGTEVELLGENITVDDLAADAGTIGYEILTSLGSRYKRIYRN